MIDRSCTNCNEIFPAERVTARFCSGRCQRKHHRRTVREMARNEWQSPPEVIRAARQVLGGIDLDPASDPAANAIVGASRYFTIRDDGLKQNWTGRIWLNPPYDKFAPKFITKFGDEYRAGRVRAACLLLAVHHMTTAWFTALCEFEPILCLPSKRLKFSGRVTTPTHGSVIIGIGTDQAAFRREFEPFGLILILCTQ